MWLAACITKQQEEDCPMRAVPFWSAAIACAFAVSLSAQDTTVKTKSKTKIEADDAKTVTLSGCLQRGDTGTFTLSNVAATPAPAEEQTATGTAGAMAAYELMPRDSVNLNAHVGHKVEITALELPAATASDDDSKIKTKTKTKVKVDDAPDTKVETRTKAELPRGATPRLTVVSVKHIAPNCTM
jgi:hypothetical protein